MTGKFILYVRRGGLAHNYVRGEGGSEKKICKGEGGSYVIFVY